MDVTDEVRAVLRDAGIGPDRVLIRPWCGGLLVTLRDDGDAAPAAKSLREAGWMSSVAGPRSVIVQFDAPD